MKTNKTITTYTRLRDGGWGVRVLGASFRKGECLETEVSKRDGSVSTESVKVIWVGEDKRTGQPVALCLIRRGNGAPRTHAKADNQQAPPHSSLHCGCGNWSGAGSTCLFTVAERREDER